MVILERWIKSVEFNEREVLYKLIFEMKKEMNDLRSLVNQIIQHTPNDRTWQEKSSPMIHELETSEANNNNNNNETHFTIQPSARTTQIPKILFPIVRP